MFAIGDVRGRRGQSTHLATYHAGVVIKRALFRLRATADPGLVPRVTFTDPEFAWVGLSEAEATAAHGRVSVLRWPFAENERAQAERTTEGHIKVLTGKGGRLLVPASSGRRPGN